MANKKAKAGWTAEQLRAIKTRLGQQRDKLTATIAEHCRLNIAGKGAAVSFDEAAELRDLAQALTSTLNTYGNLDMFIAGAERDGTAFYAIDWSACGMEPVEFGG